jgi:hypothetical protein
VMAVMAVVAAVPAAATAAKAVATVGAEEVQVEEDVEHKGRTCRSHTASSMRRWTNNSRRRHHQLRPNYLNSGHLWRCTAIHYRSISSRGSCSDTRRSSLRLELSHDRPLEARSR